MSSFWIKIIAIIVMAIDHFAVVFINYSNNYKLYFLLRAIGRIAFPIFCFFIVEGYKKTRNLEKYIIRLFIFALISEIPYDRALFSEWVDFKHQNVYFTLAFGLLSICCFEAFKDKIEKGLAIAMVVGLVAEYMGTDYGAMGVWLILFLYVFRESKIKQLFAGSFIILFKVVSSYLKILETFKWNNSKLISYYASIYKTSSLGVYALFLIEILAVIGLFISTIYNGERGPKVKYLFYLFYPVHLMILYVVSRYI